MSYRIERHPVGYRTLSESYQEGCGVTGNQYKRMRRFIEAEKKRQLWSLELVWRMSKNSPPPEIVPIIFNLGQWARML
jgi:hypothetical protein